MDKKYLQELWQKHSGKIIGAAIGMFLGILIILFGFFRTLFVFVCAVIGYIVGRRIDEKENLIDILESLLPPGYRR